MSAWIVSENHVRLLVEALYKYEVVESGNQCLTPDVLGHILWRENYKSVNHRYHEHAKTPTYTHNSAAVANWEYPRAGSGTIRELTRNSALVYKQAQHYRYQSCEHDGWEASQACALITRLCEAIEKSTGTTELEDGAPWGIE